jgi:hypothetical protein
VINAHYNTLKRTKLPWTSGAPSSDRPVTLKPYMLKCSVEPSARQRGFVALQAVRWSFSQHCASRRWGTTNQTFTILVSLRAVERLIEMHPEANGFRLALATSNGRDIESVEPDLVAGEVFGNPFR